MLDSCKTVRKVEITGTPGKTSVCLGSEGLDSVCTRGIDFWSCGQHESCLFLKLELFVVCHFGVFLVGCSKCFSVERADGAALILCMYFIPCDMSFGGVWVWVFYLRAVVSFTSSFPGS